jgi:phosphatidylglycerophosphatase A
MNSTFRKLFLTVGYSGLSKYAPGTVGTFVSIFPALLILNYLPASTLMLLAILITVVAVKEINKYEEEVGEHDSKEIVVDELVGVWIALALSSGTAIQIVLSFIFFRLFDIWKPSIIGRIDRDIKGGWGVMGDDIVAGIFGGLSSAMLFSLIEKFI